MFTGIVTDIGTVREARDEGDLRLHISCGYDLATVDLGASIACSGVCLTVVAKGGDWFAVDVSQATLERTVAQHWQTGARLNLERALRLGDELGGHLVTGHVDGLGEVVELRPEGASARLEIRVSAELGRFLAAKGSVTVDGVSLTVNEAKDAGGSTDFAINLIPHTAANTTLGALAVGDRVNIEIDVIARYLKRLEETRP